MVVTAGVPGLASKRHTALVAETVAVNEVATSSKQELWGIFSRYYTSSRETDFLRDFSSKDHVILLRDPVDETLRGFSTLMRYRREVAGRTLAVVYSGDTVIEPEYWGTTALQRAFLRYGIDWKLRNPLTHVYWLLTTKGYKTYLLLSRNFPEYWPRPERATPPWERSVIDALAREKFPERFLPERGLLAHTDDSGRLRDDVAPIEDELIAHDEHVRFFATTNPNHALGDELVCIGRIDLHLAIHYTAKLLRRRIRGEKSR